MAEAGCFRFLSHRSGPDLSIMHYQSSFRCIILSDMVFSLLYSIVLWWFFCQTAVNHVFFMEFICVTYDT